jgi:hypothetical protein
MSTLDLLVDTRLIYIDNMRTAAIAAVKKSPLTGFGIRGDLERITGLAIKDEC